MELDFSRVYDHRNATKRLDYDKMHIFPLRCTKCGRTYWFGLDFFGIEGFEELGGSLQFQALLGYSEVAHAVLQGTKSQSVQVLAAFI